MHENNTPLVSVCIQTYQHAAYIEQCIESVVEQQTPFDFEIIIGEDGSTDGTAEICRELQKKHPDIIELFERDRKDVIFVNGMPTGRNNLFQNIEASSGKYIALCEGDDYWTNNAKLATQVAIMEEREEIVASCHNTTIMENGSPVRNFSNFDKNELSFVDVTSYTSPFHTSSYIFRKSKFMRPEWFNQVASLDMAIFSVIASQGVTYYFQETFSVYRKHQEGITRHPFNRGYYLHFERIKLLDFLLNTLTLNKEEINHVNALKKRHVQGINSYFDNTFTKRLLQKVKQTLFGQ
jgi:glycosyltransferase involved in cell wall biosynthesis